MAHSNETYTTERTSAISVVLTGGSTVTPVMVTSTTLLKGNKTDTQTQKGFCVLKFHSTKSVPNVHLGLRGKFRKYAIRFSSRVATPFYCHDDSCAPSGHSCCYFTSPANYKLIEVTMM
jgi:hypothetical protein